MCETRELMAGGSGYLWRSMWILWVGQPQITLVEPCWRWTNSTEYELTVRSRTCSSSFLALVCKVLTCVTDVLWSLSPSSPWQSSPELRCSAAVLKRPTMDLEERKKKTCQMLIVILTSKRAKPHQWDYQTADKKWSTINLHNSSSIISILWSKK